MSCGSTGIDGTRSSGVSIRDSTYLLQDGTVVRLTDQVSTGRGVVSSEGFFGGAESNLIILSEDAQDTKNILQSATNWTNQGGTNFEDGSYMMELTAYSADGKPIYVVIVGQCLNSDCENATNSIMEHDGNVSLIAGGDPIKQLPNGTFVYTGDVGVTTQDITEDEAGGFSLTANFNNRTGQVVGATDSYYFSGGNLTINPATGRYDDSNGSIGRNGGSTATATVSGYFTGSNAEGVTGLVYSDLTKSEYLVGQFYGSGTKLIDETEQASNVLVSSAMTTIVETSTGLSKYLLADDVTITSTADNITVGDPVQFIIGDLNSGTVTITENLINAPADWSGNKYTFDGTTWTSNPSWVGSDVGE